MNVALILAAGSGHRTRQDIPKQFLNVFDKPIIIYTLEVFQNHPDIDKILVVCLDGWQEMLKAYGRQFGIDKMQWLVSGGTSSQESIQKGVFSLKEICNKDDIIVIHDGIRPMVSDEIISDSIKKCRQYGNGITALPIFEQIFIAKNEECTQSYIPRDTLRILQTPQSYKYEKLLWGYEKLQDITVPKLESAYTNTMMVDLGETLYFSSGSTKNIKITTKDDIEIFKALLKAEENKWLK